MTVTLVFLAVLMAVFAGWLVSQSVNVQPWVAESARTAPVHDMPQGVTAPRVGLAVFLAVVSSLFALAISAYSIRMEFGGDWRALPEPSLLWLNSGVLLLASVALQWAWGAAKRSRARALWRALTAGGACTVAFVVGQYLVWRQLDAAGYALAANPANAFFYLLTALHAAHLLGGLVAWGRTVAAVWRGASPAQVRASVELCAIYWHYLLVLWAVLFALLLNT